ncbi:MAG: hypothetical protein VKJ46_07745 [Leptolyngbyaceae bacterium]|nr:hypothetical protein [Leptolyngbyaceae bacterium]
MRFNSNVALTLILLTLMFGAGLVSAAYGFALGREALKGVTQPDIRPTSTGVGRKKDLLRQEEVVILKEEDILNRVQARIEGSSQTLNSGVRGKQATPQSTSTAAANSDFLKALPISARDRGVVLEVKSAQQQGGTLILNVNLRNQGDQTVRFLYSFLNVTDDKGRALSASAEGLPAELQPRSETFSGNVSIPTALLEDAKKLSLTLTDYPDQQLKLEVSGIPVVR